MGPWSIGGMPRSLHAERIRGPEPLASWDQGPLAGPHTELLRSTLTLPAESGSECDLSRLARAIPLRRIALARTLDGRPHHLRALRRCQRTSGRAVSGPF